MLAEHAMHIHTVLDLLTAVWLVWVLCKVDILEARITKLGG